jgi:hypothetical protein
MSAGRVRRSWSVPVVAAAVAAGAWLIGVDVVHALVIGLCLAVVVIVAQTVDLAPDPGWEPEPPPARHGSRGELVSLAWTMVGRDGRAGERLLRRVRSVGAGRLARLGLDIGEPADDAAIRELLGARAWGVLVGRGGRAPSLADVEHAVTCLERLEPREAVPATFPASVPSASSTPAPPARRPSRRTR